MQYWLMKSEPSTYSIDDLRSDKVTHWDGVRNYQARNFMRDKMEVGDQVLFYHSNAKPPGVAGLAKVAKKAYPDFSAWDPKSPYFDLKSPEDNPCWMMVDIRFVKKFPRIVSLDELRSVPELEGLMVLQKGSRLSIQPVSEEHYNVIVSMVS